MEAAERPPSRQEVEAVGDYLDSRCSDLSDEAEDGLCAYQDSPTAHRAQGSYQGERNAQAETEAADLAWRHPNPNPNPDTSPNSNPYPKPSPNLSPSARAHNLTLPQP